MKKYVEFKIGLNELGEKIMSAYREYKALYGKNEVLVKKAERTVLYLVGTWIYGIVSIPEVYVHLMFFAMMMQSCRQIFMVRERTL